MKNIRVVIITGLSGSGKSTALRALEDIGFFCVDNLPVVLLPKFLEINTDASSEITKVALVMDLREKGFLEKCMRIFSSLKEMGFQIEILFLDADDEVLLQRFRETRRTHPLAGRGSIIQGITLEREKFTELRKSANKVVDTSSYNVHLLKQVIQKHYMSSSRRKKMVINIVSFGYKYGVPDADIIMDVRFLPNPYFIKDLKALDGNDKRVKSYVLRWAESKTFLRKLFSMMEFLIPNYEKEGKAYLNIALGCTGGKHRSVVMLNRLGEHLSKKGYTVNINHRDLNRT